MSSTTHDQKGQLVTIYTDAEIGAAFRVIAASLFNGAGGVLAAAQSAEQVKTSKASATSASEGSAAPKEPSPSDPAGYTKDQLTTEYVTKRVMELAAKKGKASAKEVLASFSNAAGEPCQRASEIDAEDFTAALDKVKEAEASG